MSNLAIQTEGLSKRYRIGVRDKYPTLREALMRSATAPLRKLRTWASGSGSRDTKPSIWALRDVSFRMEEGEILGIIGRNGSGKSTLLKILTGITEPTAGYADVYGRVGSLLEVGTGFHMELTGRENVYLNGAILGMRKAEIDRKFDEIVEFSEVEAFLDTPVKRYSSGMFMRLAFAVAAHLDPEILLIDEVLAVGDAAFQKKCLGKMGKVAKEGRTILFVSHNMIAIRSLCPRAIWLDEGRVRDMGDSSHVVSSYLQSHATHTTAQVWDDVETAPGNDVFRLHQVGVRGENGSRLDMVTMQTPFTIDVEFWTLMSGINLHLSLQFVTEERMVAFCTSTADEPGIATRSLPSGLFRCSCHIPADLLNSGDYKINLLVVRDMHGVVYEYEDLLSLEIMDLQKRSEGWFGRTMGAVCPQLNWTMKSVSQNEVATCVTRNLAV